MRHVYMTIDIEKFDIIIADKNLTMEDVAKRAGLTRQRLYMILNQRYVKPQTVGKVARGLGVDVREIIELENTAK